MVIYALSSRILTRSQGHTSVGYAAYLSAERLHDTYHGEDRDFDKKRLRQRVYHSEILAPENAPAWAHDRQELWNRNEAAERRKDSQVGREIIISLPKELNHDQKIAAGLRFIREEYVSKGMVADVHFHQFNGKGSNNPHAQVLLTTRRLEKEGFAKKKEEAWRPPIVKDPRTGKVVVDPEFIKAERKAWEQHCNRALERAGVDERVDCRSLKDQGKDRLPQPKLGKAHHMEQRQEWSGRTRAGDAVREVEQINSLKAEAEQLRKEQQQIAAQARELLQRHAYDLGQTLAEEQHTQGQTVQRQPEPIPPPPKPQKKPIQKREPWKRDWERQQEQQRQQRLDIEKELERKASIQRSEATRQEEKPKPKPPLAPSQDERQLIEQWKQFHDRERGESRAISQNDQAAKPARDTSLEQQNLHLTDAMAAFGADEEKRQQAKRVETEAKLKQQRLEEQRAREAERDQQQKNRGFRR